MPHVIYHKESTVILLARARSVGCYTRNYKTEGAAKAALTRMDKKGLLDSSTLKADYAIAEAGEFTKNIEKMITRHDAMTGEAFQESINTPYSVSRASENYWCS